MALTAKQISDLNGMNEAARRASLGTLMGSFSGNVIASGSITPTGATAIITTGLTTVDHVVCSLSGSPTGDHQFSTVSSGRVAGLIWLKSWTATDVADTTPKSASAVWAVVNWVAVGEL